MIDKNIIINEIQMLKQEENIIKERIEGLEKFLKSIDSTENEFKDKVHEIFEHHLISLINSIREKIGFSYHIKEIYKDDELWFSNDVGDVVRIMFKNKRKNNSAVCLFNKIETVGLSNEITDLVINFNQNASSLTYALNGDKLSDQIVKKIITTKDFLWLSVHDDCIRYYTEIGGECNKINLDKILNI